MIPPVVLLVAWSLYLLSYFGVVVITVCRCGREIPDQISVRSYTTLTVILRVLSQFWSIISVRPRLLSVKSSLVHE